MTDDEIDDLAYGIVEDYLAEGPEYLAIAEFTGDNYPNSEDSEIEKVAVEVRALLDRAARYLF